MDKTQGDARVRGHRMNLQEAWNEFCSQYPANWKEFDKLELPAGWENVPILEVRNGCKAVIVSSVFAECFFSFYAQTWSVTDPNEPTGRVWITGPHAKYRSRLRTWIKEQAGIDIESAFPQ